MKVTRILRFPGRSELQCRQRLCSFFQSSIYDRDSLDSIQLHEVLVMFGYLIPCDGGRPIGLSKAKLVLRLKSQSAPPEGAGPEDSAELRFADGFWSIATAEQS